MTRPTVTKQNPGWRVHLNGRMVGGFGTHEDAMNRADGIATYAARYRMKRDIARIKEALNRMEANR